MHRHDIIKQIQQAADYRQNNSIIKFYLIAFMICSILFGFVLIAHAEINLNKWADAIFKAEGGYKAQYLYGIRSVKYKDEAEARKICKNTVYNTLVKYRETRCQTGYSDLECIARRYCPIGADNDPRGLNQNWIHNMRYFLKERTGE